MQSFLEKITSKSSSDYKPFLVYSGDSASGISNVIFDMSTRKMTGNYTSLPLPVEHRSGNSKLIFNTLSIPQEKMFSSISIDREMSVEFFLKITKSPVSSSRIQLVKFNNSATEGLFIKDQYLIFCIGQNTKQKNIYMPLVKTDEPMNIIISQINNAANVSFTFTVNASSKTVTIESKNLSIYSSNNDLIVFNGSQTLPLVVGGVYFYDYAIDSVTSAENVETKGTLSHYKYSLPQSPEINESIYTLYKPIIFSGKMSLSNMSQNYSYRLDCGNLYTWKSNFPYIIHDGTQMSTSGIAVTALKDIEEYSGAEGRSNPADPINTPAGTNFPIGEYANEATYGASAYSLSFGNYIYLEDIIQRTRQFETNFVIDITLSINELANFTANKFKDLICFADGNGGDARIELISSSVQYNQSLCKIKYMVYDQDNVLTASAYLEKSTPPFDEIPVTDINVGFGYSDTGPYIYYSEVANNYYTNIISLTGFEYLSSIGRIYINNNNRYSPGTILDDTYSSSLYYSFPSGLDTSIAVKKILVMDIDNILNYVGGEDFSNIAYRYQYKKMPDGSARWVQDLFNATASFGEIPVSSLLSYDGAIYNNRVEVGFPNYDSVNASFSAYAYIYNTTTPATNYSIEMTKDSSIETINGWNKQTADEYNMLFGIKILKAEDITNMPPIMKYFRFFVNSQPFIKSDYSDYRLYMSSTGIVPPEIYGGLAPFSNSLKSGFSFPQTSMGTLTFKMNEFAAPYSYIDSASQIGSISFFMSSADDIASRDILCIFNRNSGVTEKLFSSSFTNTNQYFRYNGNYISKLYINGASISTTNDVGTASLKVDINDSLYNQKYSWNHFFLVFNAGLDDKYDISFGGPAPVNYSIKSMYLDEIMLYPDRLNQLDISKIFSNYEEVSSVSATFDAEKTYGRQGITSSSPSVINVLDKETLFTNGKINLQLKTNGKLREVFMATDTYEFPNWAKNSSLTDNYLLGMQSNIGDTQYCIDNLFLGDYYNTFTVGQKYGMLFLPPLLSAGYYEFKFDGNYLQFLDASGNMTDSNPSASPLNNTSSVFYVLNGKYGGKYLKFDKNNDGTLFLNDNPQIHKIKIYKDLA